MIHYAQVLTKKENPDEIYPKAIPTESRRLRPRGDEVKNFMFGAIAVAVLLVGGSTSYLMITTAETEKVLPKLVDERAAYVQSALSAQLSIHADSIENILDRRSGAALDVIGKAINRADWRFGEVVGIADRAVNDADQQLTDIRSDADAHLVTLNKTVSDTLLPFDQLATRYMQIPDQLATAAAPSWAAVEPEITCRHADGTGYGACWHSRITGLMGEAVNIGGVFTKNFPQLSLSITGIATDAHTFTSRAVAPRGFWGNFKDIIGTSSGVVRAGAAAGIF